jgi:hypothetical protein
MQQRIRDQLPLPNSLPDPSAPGTVPMVQGDWEVVKGGNYVARPIAPYCIYVQPGGDGSGFGDVLRRDTAGVQRDLDNGVISPKMGCEVYGVVLDGTGRVDPGATQARREQLRRDRLARGVPAAAYKSRARAQILSGDLPAVAKDLYRDILGKPGRFRDEYFEFWQLPVDFEVR